MDARPSSVAANVRARSVWLTLSLCALAILGFAGNSLLTRVAFTSSTIGPGAFVGLRLIAGALTLQIICRSKGRWPVPRAGDLGGGFCLAVYAFAFTYAYVSIDAATGALILFCSVQCSMVLLTIAAGDRLGARGLAGLALALAGLVYLLSPSASTVAIQPSLLMIVAGAAWGAYTLLGRGGGDPILRTGRNFVATLPLGLAALLVDWSTMGGRGAVLAILSGSLTSAVGYAIWYAALPRLTVATAGAAQLLVPPVAALLAWPLLDEMPSARLALSAALILGGIGFTIASPRQKP